jgi:hypothetical protein
MSDETRESQIEKARGHMTFVAKGLVVVLGADDAIATLAGALTQVLLDCKGHRGAEKYLRILVEEMVKEGGPPPTLH